MGLENVFWSTGDLLAVLSFGFCASLILVHKFARGFAYPQHAFAAVDARRHPFILMMAVCVRRGGGSASPSPSIIKREPNSGNLVSPQNGGAGESASGGASGSLGAGRLGGAPDAARDGYASALSMLGGMMHPDMLVRGDGSGPTTALQIQQAMLSMQVAQGSRSQLASLPLMGVGAADAINVAERCVLRKHLSDPVLFNLCRVLVLSAMQGGDGDEGSGEAAVLKELADFTSRLCEIAKAKGADKETKDGQVGAASEAEEGAASKRDGVDGAAAPKDDPAKEES